MIDPVEQDLDKYMDELEKDFKRDKILAAEKERLDDIKENLIEEFKKDEGYFFEMLGEASLDPDYEATVKNLFSALNHGTPEEVVKYLKSLMHIYCDSQATVVAMRKVDKVEQEVDQITLVRLA